MLYLNTNALLTESVTCSELYKDYDTSIRPVV